MAKWMDELKEWGCDTKAAMQLLADDEAFYLECLQSVLVDPSFGELEEAIQAEDFIRAFDAAHALKGILANVSLTPMLVVTTEIVETLRNRDTDRLKENCILLLSMKDHLAKIILDV